MNRKGFIGSLAAALAAGIVGPVLEKMPQAPEPELPAEELRLQKKLNSFQIRDVVMDMQGEPYLVCIVRSDLRNPATIAEVVIRHITRMETKVIHIGNVKGYSKCIFKPSPPHLQNLNTTI